MNIQGRKKENFFITLLAGILFLYFFSNIDHITVIWELPDEAGYLFNAAHFAGKDWSGYADLGIAYYGYGYSLILVPFFYICKTGGEVIRSAIGLNYCMIICIYFMQIHIFCKIFKKFNMYVIAAVSFVTCFFPYIVVSANKVLCEVYLLMHIWIIALLFCRLVSSGRTGYYVAIGVEVAYLYHIHARAIAAVLVVVVMIGLYSFFNGNIRKFFAFFIPFCIAFFVGNLIKDHILLFLTEHSQINSSEMINVINGQWIGERLSWLFYPKNIKRYAVNVCCRGFYVITATGLAVVWFVKYMWLHLAENISKIRQWKVEKWLLLYFGGIFCVMFILCCVSGTGTDFGTTFYGRYIEYALVPVVGIGILAYLEMPIECKNYAMVTIVALGIASARYIDFLGTNAVNPDTSRIAGFSYWVSKNDDYQSFIYSQTVLLVLIYVILRIIQKKEFGIRILATGIVLMVFLFNDEKCKEIINKVNQDKSNEIEVAEFIIENVKDEMIYYINKEYTYRHSCTRMQAFLFDKPMQILETDDYKNHIEEGAYIIAYSNAKVCEELEKDYLIVLDNKTYCVYTNIPTE